MQTCDKYAVAFLLFVNVVLLAWSAAQHSPIVDEVGHLPAGLSHWRLRRFDLYRVNPPLVRAVATIPLHLTHTPVSFEGYQQAALSRCEFSIGSRWITTHPNVFQRNFIIARWACIPFSLLGAITCFFWARELSSPRAGWVAICLWCFCPNILAHASLITPDAGAAAVGVAACYVFRKWLIHRTLRWAAFTGVMLGLTLLTKFTWLFLLGLWPLCWLVLRVSSSHSPSNAMQSAADTSDRVSQFVTRRVTATLKPRWRDDIGHLSLIVLIAVWLLNSGYLFEDSFQPLGKFPFFSQSFAGHEPGHQVGEPGNRFQGTLLEYFPVPVPRNFLQGIDHIKFEYEMGYRSYLRGVKRHGGWWYYYLYAMLVKMPVGTLVLIGVATGMAIFYHRGRREYEGGTVPVGVIAVDNSVSEPLRILSVFSVVNSAIRRFCDWVQSGKNRTRRADALPLAGGLGSDLSETLFLLAPAIGTLWLVSSQTGFNHHLRYVLPAFPFLFIFASRTALLLDSRYRPIEAVPIVCTALMIISSLSVYPHSLSYFNELAGGPINGWKHLDYSNIDWGQDMILVKEWVELHPEAKPLYILPSGYVTPEQMGIETQPLQMTTQPSPDGKSLSRESAPGWYILGLTRLVDPNDPFHELLQLEPDGYIGYSMRIYHVQ